MTDPLRRLLDAMPVADEAARAAAAAHQGQLTKPAGSLGRLEDIAVWLAGWQGTGRPKVDHAHVLIFAGNHGVASLGVSAFPAEVTTQMVANFTAGGAAINQLSEAFGAAITVVPLDLDTPTAAFTDAPAMSAEACAAAIEAGVEAVPDRCDLLLVGEMGIGNTTTAAALAYAMFGGDATDWVGRGTGVDDAGLARKISVIEQARRYHGAALDDPFEALRRVGGRELAAIAGAVAAARQRRVPVILDGYVTAAAVGALHRIDHASLDHCLAGHRSVEPGHGRLLTAMGLEPLLDLSMRLGEASGAAVALAVVRAALAAHNGMATFADAGVSGKSDD